MLVVCGSSHRHKANRDHLAPFHCAVISLLNQEERLDMVTDGNHKLSTWSQLLDQGWRNVIGCGGNDDDVRVASGTSKTQ